MTILVYYESMPVYLYPAVANRLGLTDGQHLSSHSEFVRALGQNATHYALLRLAQSQN